MFDISLFFPRCLEEGCGKVFKSSFSLNTHLKNVHEGRKYKVITNNPCFGFMLIIEYTIWCFFLGGFWGIFFSVRTVHKRLRRVVGLKFMNISILVLNLSSKVFIRSLISKTFRTIGSVGWSFSSWRCPHGDCEKAFLLPSKLKAHEKCHAGIRHLWDVYERWSWEHRHDKSFPLGYVCTKPGCNLKFEKWTLVRKHIHLDHRPG